MTTMIADDVADDNNDDAGTAPSPASSPHDHLWIRVRSCRSLLALRLATWTALCHFVPVVLSLAGGGGMRRRNDPDGDDDDAPVADVGATARQPAGLAAFVRSGHVVMCDCRSCRGRRARLKNGSDNRCGGITRPVVRNRFWLLAGPRGRCRRRQRERRGTTARASAGRGGQLPG